MNPGFSLYFALVAICGTLAAVAAPPVITRVEPPNWWAGHSLNPVRVLVEGWNLTGASVQSADGIVAGPVAVSSNGSCALLDLTIAPRARAGSHALRLTTAGGSTTFPFPLASKLSTRAGFEGFSPDDVIYLAMTDRFANGDAANDDPLASRGLFDRSKPRHYHGGDFAGAIQRLPYLKELGVTALWLTPWYDNVNHLNELERYTADNQRGPTGRASTDYHGYGAVDFYEVEEHFGDIRKLRELVTAAHRLKLKVIQDQVANHTGPYHRWTTNSPTPTWFNGTVADHLENTWQTWTIADPNPPADKLKSTLDGWFINLLPDLNQNDAETSRYLIQNSLWWLEMTGLDAIRQDTLPYVPRSHWARWSAAVKREYPRVTILGEMWDGYPKLVSFFQGGRVRFDGVDSGIDTLFDFPLHYAIRDVFAKGQPMTRLSQTLAADTNYVNPRVLVTFLGLHDTGRFLNEPGASIDGLKLAFTYLLTTRGTPLIYYGDEIAMRGGGDPDNRRDFPGGWRKDSHNAFTRRGRTEEEQGVHAQVKKLLSLRRELEPLRRGELVELATADATHAFARVTTKALVVVAFNNSAQPQTVELDLRPVLRGNPRALTDRLGELGRVALREGRVRLGLAPRSGAVLAQ